MASQQEIQNVIDNTDVVALVSEYITLEKQGKNYKGLCPFHHEDTPSFVVNQEKKVAHCFGCGGGGNPIKFLMQIENLDFGTALRKLAKRNGIELHDMPEEVKTNPLTKYYQINQTAQAFYKKYLESTDQGRVALDYLHKRGLDDETIKVFGIGLAPLAYDSLYQVLKEYKYLELDMYDTGLVDKNERGYYDIFTNRIIFPICNENGNVLGFSGRIYNTTDKNQPKYVNTKDTIAYKKKQVLFNLHIAKGEIMRKKRVILHEGQMDVIASYRSGLKEAICTMGTALSLEQASLLKKYTNHVIICYDGDGAGIRASLKAIHVFQSLGFIIHLVLLPNGSDPDEYVLKNGTEAYSSYFESHLMDYQSFIYEQAILNKNLEDASVVDAIKEEVFDMLYMSSSKIIEEQYLKKLSILLQTSIESLSEDYKSYYTLKGPRKNVDISKEEKIIVQPVKKSKKELGLSKYEIRLFMYAKSSKEKALYIDRYLNDRMEAISKENLRLWISLINGYYEKYEEFNEENFFKLLSLEEQEHYTNILQCLRKDKTPYTDEDLNDCLEKLNIVKYDKRNEKLSESIDKIDDLEEQARLIAEKFKNKKNKELLEKKRRK